MRGSDGRFLKGESGNPAGLKPGTKHRKTLLREELEKDGSALAAAIKQKALEGDMQAAALWLTRLEPVARDRGETVQFNFDPKATPAQNIEAILVAVAAGEVTVETGAQLISSIERLANVRESAGGGDREQAIVDALRDFATKCPA
jgi:hypothetical protein